MSEQAIVEAKVEEGKQEVSMASQATQEEQKTHDVQYADEETTAKVRRPLCLTNLQVDVPKVAAKPADSGLECIFKMRTKLYRFNDN